MILKIDYKKPAWTAALTALVCGVITHLFGLVTVMHNNDDIGQQPYGYGTGISSGRWLLTVLGDFVGENGGNYNLHFVNGLLFLVLLAASAGIVVSTFRLKKRWSAALTGMLFTVFPSVASTMFFRYTTVYYGISVLLAVTAAWIADRCKHSLILSSICIALSLGIYQAYVPLTISIFVLLLIKQALENNTDALGLIRKGFYYCSILILGLLIYYLCLKVLLAVYGTELSTYDGINNMGKLAIADIPKLVKKALYTFCMLPFKNYCGLANMQWIRISYLLLGGITALIILYILLVKVRKVSIILVTALLCCVFPIAVNFVVIMCPDGYIYTIMLYAFALVGCVPLILLECLPTSEGNMQKFQPVVEKAVALVIAVLVFHYAYDTNINYSAQYYANRQTENYLNAMVVQVRMTEGFDTDKEWAFIGQVEDPLLRTPWQYESRFGGNDNAHILINWDNRYSWFQTYFGYTIPFSDSEKIAELSQTEEVKAMPCWPNEGSIKVIGDTVVIKCQNIE